MQQGTTAYLKDLLHRDPKLRAYLDANPDLASKLASGKVHVEYKLVRARATGTVGINDFVIDRTKLGLEDLDRSVTATR